jgi:hypothetical protein
MDRTKNGRFLTANIIKILQHHRSVMRPRAGRQTTAV